MERASEKLLFTSSIQEDLNTLYGKAKKEARLKFENLSINHPFIKLHLTGPLQTNKVKHVLPLFDYIHSLDNIKLAEKISNEQLKIGKKIKIFIQVNIGDEKQKNGIGINELRNFKKVCIFFLLELYIKTN